MAAIEDKLVTMGQLKRYVESVIGGGGGGSSTVLYEGDGRQQVSLQLAEGEYDYLEVDFGLTSTTGYITNSKWVTQSVMTSPSGGDSMGYQARFTAISDTKLFKIINNSTSLSEYIFKVTGYKK